MFAVDIIMSIVDPFEKKHARLASAFLVFCCFSRRSRLSRSANPIQRVENRRYSEAPRKLGRKLQITCS